VLDRLNGAAVALEQRRCRHDKLQLEIAVLRDGLQSGAIRE
jgi:hypothetical protein